MINFANYFLTYADISSCSHPSFTHSLTTWKTIFLGKQIIAQLVKKHPAFYETKMFVTMFRRALSIGHKY
jgi:hypothetical protein